MKNQLEMTLLRKLNLNEIIIKLRDIKPVYLQSFLIQFATLTLVYSPNIISLISWWVDKLRYQMFVFLLLLLMLGKRGKELFARQVAPHNSGFIPLIIGITTLLIGRFAGNHLLQEFSIIFTISGIIIINCGFFHFKLLFLPILYILFSSHIFFVIPDNFSAILQIISTKIATTILHLLNFNILVNGTYIRLPATILHVVDLCSGYNQLFTLGALMIPIVYITHRSAWKQLFIISLCFPVGILLNSLRIALIGIYNYSKVREYVHGPYEIYRMPFIFLGGLFILTIISNLIVSKSTTSLKSSKLSLTNTDQDLRKIKRAAIVVACILLLVAILGNAHLLIKPHTHWQFPEIIENRLSETGWKSITTLEKPVKFQSYYEMPLKPEKETQHLYISQLSDTLIASILWFQTQCPGNEPFFYRPGSEGESRRINIYGTTVPCYTTTRSRGHQMTATWFIVDEQPYTKRSDAWYATLKQALLKRKYDAFICILNLKTARYPVDASQNIELLKSGFTDIMQIYHNRNRE